MTAPTRSHDYARFAEPLAHPGAHLREDFLSDYGLTPGALAKAMGLKDRTRIESPPIKSEGDGCVSFNR